MQDNYAKLNFTENGEGINTPYSKPALEILNQGLVSRCICEIK